MQFSIKHLIGWTTLVAMVCAVLFAVPNWIAVVVMALALVWMPILAICGLVYGRGWRRTFFIGVTIAATPICLPLMMYLTMGMAALGEISFDDLNSVENEAALTIKIGLGVFYTYVSASGLVAMFTRWLVSPPAAPAPSTNQATAEDPNTSHVATQSIEPWGSLPIRAICCVARIWWLASQRSALSRLKKRVTKSAAGR